MSDRETFKKNYTGVYDADKYYDYLVECEKIENLYRNATYSTSTNRQFIRSRQEQAFNRHLRA